MHALVQVYGFDEYAEVEAASELRFELLDGQLIAMAGGTLEHADLIAEIAASLRAQLGQTPCRVTTSDLRVGHDPSAFRAYPDVVVRCAEPVRSPLPPKDTLLNPELVVEVTSDRTATYDRGRKLRAYQKIEGLKVIVIISHTEARIDVHTRTQTGWTEAVFGPGEMARALDGRVELGVDALYAAAGLHFT